MLKWQQIKEDLDALLSEKTMVAFHPLLEKINYWLSADPKPYPSEVFTGLLELLNNAKNDIEKGMPISEILDQVQKGTYWQPNWEAQNVYQSNGHIFQFIFADMQKNLKLEKKNPAIVVPIILMVMTSSEAEELVSGQAFDGYPNQLLADFQSVYNIMSELGKSDFIQAYGKTRQAWIPFVNESKLSLGELISETFGYFPREMPKFSPHFIELINLPRSENRNFLRELREKGCILIIDIVSTRHPKLQQALQQSLLDAYPHTSIVTISPIHSLLEVVKQMTITIQIRISEMEYYKRKGDFGEDFGVSREVDSVSDFQRWLFDRTKKVFPIRFKNKKGVRSYMYNDLSLE